MQITVLNFGKYNPRGDVKNPSWVRLERNWWVDMWGWSADAQRIWFMFLGLADFSNGKFECDENFISANLRIPVTEVNNAIAFLVDKKRIETDIYVHVTDTVRTRNAHGTDTGVTDERTNGTNETESPISESAPADAPPKENLVSFTDWDMRASTWLQAAIVFANPDARKVHKANLNKWANEFRLMRERDKLDKELIAQVMQWVFEHDPDPFWRSQIQSAATFREKWDRLTARMNNQAPREFGLGFR